LGAEVDGVAATKLGVILGKMKTLILILLISFAFSCKPNKESSQFNLIVNSIDSSIKGLHFIGPLINGKLYQDQENINVKPGEKIYIKFTIINNSDDSITINELNKIIYNLSYKNEPENLNYRIGGGRLLDPWDFKANLIIQPHESKTIFLTKEPQTMYNGTDSMKIIYSFKIRFMCIFSNGTSNRYINSYNFNICNK
jgi:hypothetical protein